MKIRKKCQTALQILSKEISQDAAGVFGRTALSRGRWRQAAWASEGCCFGGVFLLSFFLVSAPTSIDLMISQAVFQRHGKCHFSFFLHIARNSILKYISRRCFLLVGFLTVLLVFVSSVPSSEKFWFHKSFYIHLFFSNAVLSTNHHP